MRRKLRDRTRKVLQEDRLVEYKKLFARVDKILDGASSGPLWLGDKRIADLVQDALVNRYAGLYFLWAYVVMANSQLSSILHDYRTCLSKFISRILFSSQDMRLRKA